MMLPQNLPRLSDGNKITEIIMRSIFPVHKRTTIVSGRRLEPYLLLAPALGILLIFLIFPLFWNTYISLHDVSLTTILRQWEYIGGTNFIDLFSDPNFYTS